MAGKGNTVKRYNGEREWRGEGIQLNGIAEKGMAGKGNTVKRYNGEREWREKGIQSNGITGKGNGGERGYS